MDSAPPTRHPVTCDVDGKLHQGTYWVARTILTVATGLGGVSRQVCKTEPEALAVQLLTELVWAGKA